MIIVIIIIIIIIVVINNNTDSSRIVVIIWVTLTGQTSPHGPLLDSSHSKAPLLPGLAPCPGTAGLTHDYMIIT